MVIKASETAPRLSPFQGSNTTHYWMKIISGTIRQKVSINSSCIHDIIITEVSFAYSTLWQTKSYFSCYIVMAVIYGT